MEKEKDMQAIKIVFYLRCKRKDSMATHHLAKEAEYLVAQDFDLANVRQFCWQHATRLETRLRQDPRFDFVKAHSYLMPLEQAESPKVLNEANALKHLSGQVKDLIKDYACVVHLGTSLRYSNEFNHLLDTSTQGPKQQKSYEQIREV